MAGSSYQPLRLGEQREEVDVFRILKAQRTPLCHIVLLISNRELMSSNSLVTISLLDQERRALYEAQNAISSILCNMSDSIAPQLT